MTLLLVLSGLALIGVATADALTTTVSLGSGAGPVTSVVSRSVWAVARAIWPHRHGALRRAGVAVLLCSILSWIVLVWAGWSLVFSAADAAVVDALTGAPASVEQRIYFAGYTLLTLGNGDFRPDGPLWRMATVLAAGNGFGLVTLSISYLVPVVSAATEKRQLAAHLHALGPSPQDLVAGGWDGSSFAPLVRDLAGLHQQLLLHQQRHHTYPVLHYFHATEPAVAAPLRLAALDEGLTLLFHGVAPHARPDDRRLTALGQALDAYLDTVTASYLDPPAESPPPPDLTRLREAGIPTVDDSAFADAVRRLAERRRRLLGLVQHDAWTWDDIAR
jgi:hypothetical protein